MAVISILSKVGLLSGSCRDRRLPFLFSLFLCIPPPSPQGWEQQLMVAHPDSSGGRDGSGTFCLSGTASPFSDGTLGGPCLSESTFWHHQQGHPNLKGKPKVLLKPLSTGGLKGTEAFQYLPPVKAAPPEKVLTPSCSTCWTPWQRIKYSAKYSHGGGQPWFTLHSNSLMQIHLCFMTLVSILPTVPSSTIPKKTSMHSTF